MRRSALALVFTISACAPFTFLACSGGGGDGGNGPSPDGTDGAPLDGSGGSDGAAGNDASPADGAAEGAADARADADGGAGEVDGGEDAGPPAVQLVGRIDESDPLGPRLAWPGTRVRARFHGTDATVKLSRTFAGFQGGPTWFNVIVDGVVGTPFSVSAGGEDHVLAAGLPAGVHTVEIEKRTEANHGTVRFEGFTFAGGSGLLAPPPRPVHRIEWISESTIDGFGVEGDRNVTCIGTAPPQYDNVRKSLATYTAEALGAESHVTAYSGKGIADTNSGLANDPLTMPLLWTRALPDPGAGVAWDFAKWTPEVVVVSLGGVDFRNGVSGAAGDFQAKYEAFVADIRARYGAAPWVYLVVWSQIKNNGGNANVRTALGGFIDGVVAARAALGDAKVKKLVFPEANVNADETGCYYHANAAHHQAMATLLVADIKAVTGW